MKMSYEKNFKSDRKDGRHISTMAAHMEMLRDLRPKLALPEDLTKESFCEWKAKVRAKLQELLLMPEFTDQPEPVFISREKRDGYSLEKLGVLPRPIQRCAVFDVSTRYGKQLFSRTRRTLFPRLCPQQGICKRRVEAEGDKLQSGRFPRA